VWRAEAGESILAADGRLALVRTADRGQVRAIELAGGRVAWRRPIGRSVEVTMGPGVVVLADPGAIRLVVLSAAGSVLADAGTGATVLGYADGGLLINVGRRVGLLRYTAART
jgi:hypothetical protein